MILKLLLTFVGWSFVVLSLAVAWMFLAQHMGIVDKDWPQRIWGVLRGKGWRKPAEDDEEIEGAFEDAFDAMDHLNVSSVEKVHTSAGAVMHVRCKSCGQKNRLKKGFRNYQCGRCKNPFMSDPEVESKEKSGSTTRYN